MENEIDIFNQTTEALGNSDVATQLADFQTRLEILERRVGRTTRELGPQSSNITKELEEMHQELDRLKSIGVVHKLMDDLKRRCIYCGKGAYKRIFNGRNIGSHEALQLAMTWGIESTHQNSFREWIVQRCNHCGNVQYFAVPGDPNPDGWG